MSQLRESRSRRAVTGVVEVQLGPVPPWSAWSVERVAVSATGGDPEARLYRDTVSEATLLGGTYSGKLDTYNPAAPLALLAGQSLIVVFSGALIGSQVSVSATGQREP
jgi:hypothetical protein